MPVPSAPGGNTMTGRALGRRPATDEMRKRTLPLRNFVKLVGRPVPETDDYATKAQAALVQMMGNDAQGDCVAVTIAKQLGIFNAYRPRGSVIVATTAEVLAWYHAVGGPGDNGLYIPNALDYLVRHGMKIGRAVHKIEGYAAVDNSDDALVDAAFHWFGGLHLGVNLTRQQWQHADDSDQWDLDGTPVVGGHSVPLTMRWRDKFQLATWARQPTVTRRAVRSRNWCDECYVIFGPDWFDELGMDANNVNVAALRAALEALKQGGTPDIPPDPNPPTPPVPPGPPVPGGGVLTATGTLDFFGKALPIALTGTVASALATGFPSVWVIVADLAAVMSAFRARDWVAVASAVAKLLADLGLNLTPAEFDSMISALKAERETAVLLADGPPAPPESVDATNGKE